MSLGFDVFAVAPKPIPSAVPGFEQAVGPATWPPSTSTLISDDDGALLVDCLITEQEGRKLAAWVKSHDRELRYVYITHPHADHFLGLPEILAEFPEARPVALAESIAAMEEQISPGYMQVWGGFFPRQPPRQPSPAGAAGGHHYPRRRLGGHGDPGRDLRHRAFQPRPRPGPEPGRLRRRRIQPDAHVADGVDTGFPR